MYAYNDVLIVPQQNNLRLFIGISCFSSTFKSHLTLLECHVHVHGNNKYLGKETQVDEHLGAESASLSTVYVGSVKTALQNQQVPYL